MASSLGPLRMELMAITAASLYRQLLDWMCCRTKGMMPGTMASLTVFATNCRQVAPLMLGFHWSSSISASSSCLVSNSARIGTSSSLAALTYPKQTLSGWGLCPVSASFAAMSLSSISFSASVLHNSMACNATFASSLRMVASVNWDRVCMYACSLS